MKRRILLILALGVSFTPAIFAAPGIEGKPHHLGQLTPEEAMTSPGLVGCNLRDKEIHASGSDSSAQGSSTAVSAH